MISVWLNANGDAQSKLPPHLADGYLIDASGALVLTLNSKRVATLAPGFWKAVFDHSTAAQ